MHDLISRQDAIDALHCINGVEEVLRSLPSAQFKGINKGIHESGVRGGGVEYMRFLYGVVAGFVWCWVCAFLMSKYGIEVSNNIQILSTEKV